MIAANAATAERAGNPISGRVVVAKGVTPQHYLTSPEFSTFAPIGSIAAEIVLQAICRARNVSPPVGRVLMHHAGLGRALP